MSTIYTRQVPRIGDKALLATFKRLAETLGIENYSYQTITQSTRTISISEFSTDPAIKAVSKADGFVVIWVQLVLGRRITITLSRNREPQSAYWETLKVDRGDQIHDWPEDERLKAELAIAAAFKFEGHADVQPNGDPATFQVLFNQYEASLSHLRAMAAEQLDGLAKRRASIDDDLQKERDRLKDEFDLKEVHLKNSIEDREKALDQRLKDADESDAKTARRAIRSAMLSDVQDRLRDFEVSHHTLRKRQSVRAGFYFLISVFFVVLVSIWLDVHQVSPESGKVDVAKSVETPQSQTGNGLAPPPTAASQASVQIRSGGEEQLSSTIGAWIRFALAFLGMVATVLYYIRWEMRWADLHATNEFQLRQFHIDVNRANWVIESALEWKKETEEIPPPELLAQLTKNLFSNQTDAAAEKVLHPADELASALLGSASKLSLNVAGNEVVFDKPSKIPRATKL